MFSLASKIFHPRKSRNIRLGSDRLSNSRLSAIDEHRNLDETMAQPNSMDLIYKSLRLVPEFDGNPHILTRFINLCDQLVLAHITGEPGKELENVALLNGILNKVSGSAARLINSNGIPNTWQGIRNALINNFADHRDETALYSDLSLETQGSSTPQEFYERCQNLFSTIMTYVSLHETLGTTVEAKRALYQKLTLQAYLRGLKDPLGSRIRCMRPESMEKALEFVQEELNTLYMQERSGTSSRKDWQQPISNAAKFNLPLNNFNPRFNNGQYGQTRPIFNMPGPSRPNPMQAQPHQGWRPNPNSQQPPRGPTRTQQMFRAPPQNYNAQSNTFRLPFRPQPQQSFNFGNAPRPTPMSGVSNFAERRLPMTGHDWRKHGNPPPTNYFKTREINFNEFDGYDNYYCDDYDSYSDYYNDFYSYDQYPDYYSCDQYSYQEPPVVEEIPPSDENFQKDSKSEKPK